MGLQAYVIFPAPSDLQFDTSPRAGGWCGQHTILQQYWSCLTALVSLSDNSAASQRCCLPYNRGCPGITQHKLELQPKWRVVWGDGTETNPVGLLAHRSYSELEINPTRVACSTHMSALCSPQPQVTVLNLFCNHRWLCSSFLWLMFLGHHWHPTSDRGRGSVTSVAKSMKTVFIWSLWREKRWRKKNKTTHTKQTKQNTHTKQTNRTEIYKIHLEGDKRQRWKIRKPHDRRQLWVTFLAITTCKSSPPPALVADCQEQVN